MLTATSGVAVLLFLIAGSALTRADLPPPDGGGPGGENNLRLFRFACEFQILMGPGRLDGLMASDGSRSRIAIYWVEPDVFREAAPFVRHADFIIDQDAVHYWAHGLSHLKMLRRSDLPANPLLPQQNSVESIVQATLAIANSLTRRDSGTDVALDMGRFFQNSRGQADYTYEPSVHETDRSDRSPSVDTDADMLNTSPGGREYSRETEADGTLRWCAKKAINGQPVVTVTVKPLIGVQGANSSGLFDPNSLGQCSLIPEPYRVYWAFDQTRSQMSQSADERAAGRDLCAKIESYLRDDATAPPQVRWGMHRLLFKTALMTDDADLVRRSAQATVVWLCQDDSFDAYRRLLELARISGQIDKQYPQHAEQWLRPWIGQILEKGAHDVEEDIAKLMLPIQANKWFTCGNLLLEEVRRRGLVDKSVVGAMARRLNASRMAEDREPSDPNESTASVKQYLSQLDAIPSQGTIEMDDVRHILDEGLAEQYPAGASEEKRKLVEDAVHSIRLIVGEGPFCGDRDRLIESIQRFSRHCLVVNKSPEPIDTVLATFLGLSFCDTSTCEDHALLISQIQGLLCKLRSQTNEMLSVRELTSFVTEEDVGEIFEQYEVVFRRYVDDPLWPTFKFPLTPNEVSRLGAKLRLRLMQVEPLLDEISLQVRYGGSSAELKERVVRHLSLAVQQLLPQAAFLRTPGYPGVSCQYHGGHGFSVVIKGAFYEEGNRPKEKFKAMKYFHLGHRLQDIVERERQLTRSLAAQELSQ